MAVLKIKEKAIPVDNLIAANKNLKHCFLSACSFERTIGKYIYFFFLFFLNEFHVYIAYIQEVRYFSVNYLASNLQMIEERNCNNVFVQSYHIFNLNV